MATLPRHAVWVIVDDLQVRDLRVQFKVTKTMKKDPNSAEIIITNLKESTRAQMRNKGAHIELLAGYDTRVQQIFSGASRRINHVHERPDWNSTIECGDGEQEFLWRRVSESFKPGTKWKDVVRAVAKSFVKDPGNLDEKLAGLSDTFGNGYTAHGRSAAVLDKLLKGRNLEWSIQDGRLQLLGPGEANSDSITVISADTGLIGSPAFGSPDAAEAPGVKAAARKALSVLKLKSRLQPHLRPGSKIRVESRTISGNFRVVELHHEGDTHGQSWYTELEATAHADST